MQKLIRFTITIEEAIPNNLNKSPLLKLTIPLDSKKKHVLKKSHRAVRDLIYFLFERGYTNPSRVFWDCHWWDNKFKWNEQPIKELEDEDNGE